MSKKINALTALTAAAAQISASSVQAEAMPEDRKVAYRFTQYTEDDSPRERTFTQETKRYDISVHQIGFSTPVTSNWQVSGELQYETLSGASPMQTYKNDEGRSVLFMSGASINETRTDIKVTPKRYFEDGTVAVTLANSSENDYESNALGLDGSLEIYDKHTTLLWSFSTSQDKLSPTDANKVGFESRKPADGAKKRTTSFYQGVSQVINKISVVQAGVGYTKSEGYLSDPYKTADRRPEEREAYTISGQYRHFFKLFSGAALHTSYRYYWDDWKVSSHTIDAKWHQKFDQLPTGFGQRFDLRVTPEIRYYRQDDAEFYSLQETPPAGELNSSDARLSKYGAINMALALRVEYDQIGVTMRNGYYFSDTALAIYDTSSDETPALVNYSTFSLGVDYTF